MVNKKRQDTIENKKARLEMYYTREIYMLSPDGVRGYGMGSRNLHRYETALRDIQAMIKKLEDEIAELESDGTPRRAVAVVPRDW